MKITQVEAGAAVLPHNASVAPRIRPSIHCCCITGATLKGWNWMAVAMVVGGEMVESRQRLRVRGTESKGVLVVEYEVNKGIHRTRCPIVLNSVYKPANPAQSVAELGELPIPNEMMPLAFATV